MPASLSLAPDYHSSAGHVPRIVVDLTDEGSVALTIEAEPGETFDDRDLSRTLSADEARALAAALWHFAGEAIS